MSAANPRIAEYGTLRPEQFGAKTTLAAVPRRNGTMRLIHRTAGYQIAGSMARFDAEAWGSIYECRTDGTTHGQWFRTEAEARARFDAIIAANPD